MIKNICYKLEQRLPKKRVIKTGYLRNVLNPRFLGFVIFFILIVFSANPEYTQAAGGSGTARDPYKIDNCIELQAIKNDLDAYYILGNYIFCSDTVNWNRGQGFSPIKSFTGHFDGKMYSIFDLYIGRPDGSLIGLFADPQSGSVIKNVGLRNVDITGRFETGGLAGINLGTITNSVVTGRVNGTLSTVGGLVGLNSGKICSSYSTARVNSDGPDAGGLVGRNSGTIITSHATGNVNSTGDYVGGLVGSNSSGTIRGSYATGNVTANNTAAGGLVGHNGYNNALISDCFATGDVSAGSGAYVRAGGLVGSNGGTGWATEKIDKCYSTGIVSGSANIGGLVGRNSNSDGTITNSFWDVETSGLFISDGGIGKKTWQMKTISTFTNAGWNFRAIWDISASANNGYPFIMWTMAADECIGCPHPVGHNDYCRDCGPCSEGEGDCDNDSECEPGLSCPQIVGTDTCQATGCPHPVGHLDYCRDCGPCAEGEGDCDNDSECQSGLTCAQVTGTDYCQTGGCPHPVGHLDYCRDCGPCGAGQGDCDNNSECQSGLSCVQVTGTDVCCQHPLGHLDYCRDCGPCAAGQGDCDNDSECQSGLTCVQVIGTDTCQ